MCKGLEARRVRIVGRLIGPGRSESSWEATPQKYLECIPENLELILKTARNLTGALSREGTVINFVFRNHSDSSV